MPVSINTVHYHYGFFYYEPTIYETMYMLMSKFLYQIFSQYFSNSVLCLIFLKHIGFIKRACYIFITGILSVCTQLDLLLNFNNIENFFSLIRCKTLIKCRSLVFACSSFFTKFK